MSRDAAGCLVGVALRLRDLLLGGPRQAGDLPPPVPADAPAAMPTPDVMVSKLFISEGERAFLPTLYRAVGRGVWVAPQVAINRLLHLTRRCPAKRAWQNKIDRRSVDFVLIDRATLRPIAAVELDDVTHRRPDRQKRDHEVDRLFAEAGLPLLHVPAAAAYDAAELRRQLEALGVELPAA